MRLSYASRIAGAGAAVVIHLGAGCGTPGAKIADPTIRQTSSLSDAGFPITLIMRVSRRVSLRTRGRFCFATVRTEPQDGLKGIPRRFATALRASVVRALLPPCRAIGPNCSAWIEEHDGDCVSVVRTWAAARSVDNAAITIAGKIGRKLSHSRHFLNMDRFCRRRTHITSKTEIPVEWVRASRRRTREGRMEPCKLIVCQMELLRAPTSSPQMPVTNPIRNGGAL